MDAGERLFLDKGVAATSIDDVVHMASVAKGTFYLYFASKDKLLLALRERFLNGICDALQSAVDAAPSHDSVGRLHIWVRTMIALYLDRMAVHDIVFHEFNGHGEGASAHADPVYVVLIQLLRDGQDAGVWTVSDPDLTAVMIFNALHGAVNVTYRAEGATLDRDRLEQSVWAFLQGALRLKD